MNNDGVSVYSSAFKSFKKQLDDDQYDLPNFLSVLAYFKNC